MRGEWVTGLYRAGEWRKEQTGENKSKTMCSLHNGSTLCTAVVCVRVFVFGIQFIKMVFILICQLFYADTLTLTHTRTHHSTNAKALGEQQSNYAAATIAASLFPFISYFIIFYFPCFRFSLVGCWCCCRRTRCYCWCRCDACLFSGHFLGHEHCFGDSSCVACVPVHRSRIFGAFVPLADDQWFHAY